MVGIEQPFAHGGLFGLAVKGLTVEDEFIISLSAPDRECHFDCPPATTAAFDEEATKTNLLNSYAIVWIVLVAWIGVFFLFFVVVSVIISALYRNAILSLFV